MGWYNRYRFMIWGSLVLPGCWQFVSKQDTGTSGKQLQEVKMGSKDISQIAGAAMDKPAQNQDRIAPGTCRITGKIIRILPTLEKDKNTPCGKVPCTALVQVQKVLGYGTAFNKTLAANKEIKVYFSFTLHATAKVFPELTSSLPGLKTGDIFVTDLQHITESQTGEADLYKVDTYKILP